MQLGIFSVATERALPMVELAPAVEARGFDSLWVPEHSHLPIGSVYPAGRSIPDFYTRTMDPFVTLAMAAAVTKTLRLGTGVCLIMQRDTIFTAKEVATLDVVSNGRVELGLGAGWNRKEMEHHGVDYDSRYQRMMDQIRALKTIWRDDIAEHDGPFVQFGPMRSWPKPAQRPHPPLFIGGESIHTLRRVVAECDGWLPRARDPQQVLDNIPVLQRMAAEAGRSINITVFACPPDPEWVSKFHAAGVDRLIFMLNEGDRDKTLERLDRFAGLAGA